MENTSLHTLHKEYRVEKGQLLIEFDIQGIQAAGYVVTTPVVITNTDKYDVVVAEANRNSKLVRI